MGYDATPKDTGSTAAPVPEIIDEIEIQHGDKSALPSGTFDPVYEAKARELNKAIQAIGMGKYQWQLFVVIGFGWASDNLWPIVTSLILTAVGNEFKPSYNAYLSLSQNIGLLIGAIFWGFGCDLFGRKWAFNLTIGITGVFGLIAAGSPNFAAICVFAALWSVGVGGNLPVDSAIFLEFLPASHQYLLTVLSIDWAFAQLVASLVAWPLLGDFTCQQTDTDCTRSKNMGWRYFMIAMGGLSMVMFVIRFALFTIYESPKYLMSRGKDADAVAVVHEVARRNGRTSDLTLDDLTQYDSLAEGRGNGVRAQQTSAVAALERNLDKVSFTHVRSLFSTVRLGISTSMVTTIWAFIGLGYPLYNAYASPIRRYYKGNTNSAAASYPTSKPHEARTLATDQPTSPTATKSSSPSSASRAAS